MGVRYIVQKGEVVTAELMNMKLETFKIEDLKEFYFFPRHISKKFIQTGTATTAEDGTATITFPIAFDTIPVVLIQPVVATYAGYKAEITEISVTGFKASIKRYTGGITTTSPVHTHSITPDSMTMTHVVDVKACPAGHSGCAATIYSRTVCKHGTYTTTSTAEHSHSGSLAGIATSFNWLAICV